MGTYVEVAGLNTWYDEAGEGDPLVLLHGGLSTNDTWAAQVPAFAERFHVIAPERRGHGHTPDVDGPLTYDVMAADTIAFLETVVGEAAHLAGWSDGGIVGLLVAIARPDLVRKLVVMSANYDVDGLVPEAHDMTGAAADAPEVAIFRALYAASSPDGPDHWPVVFAKFAEMSSTEPHIWADDLGRISAPTLVMSGDDDLITLEHTIALHRAIGGSELAIVPGTSHALAIEKADLVNRLVIDFLASDASPTLMPVRRATP